MNLKYKILATAVLLLAAVQAWGQEVRTDTISLNVYFRRNVTEIEPAFRDNGMNMAAFRAILEYQLNDPDATVDGLIIRSGASPEGPYKNNLRLSDERGANIGAWLADTPGLDPMSIGYNSVGEDWEGLEKILETLDEPWKDDALNIIRNIPQWENGVERRKEAMKALSGGNAWRWLDDNVFPDLRSAGGSVQCIITRPVITAAADTVVIGPVEGIGSGEPVPVDTVYVEVPPRKPLYDLTGKKMILALRTNFAMIPLTNIGVEVPLGEHWSVGADWYSPWIWRPLHKEGLDQNGWCFELQALDLEARYWFPNKNKRPEQRLLGHSIALYGAVGHYDFERNFTGHQGEFYNGGLDYLYATPIWGGRMHMEFELGIGYIYSPSQPYDTCVAGDKAFRRRGYTQYTHWFGPTRAQVSLVWPIYVKTNKGGDK